MGKYVQGGMRWKIVGTLRRTGKKVKPVCVPVRTVHVDDAGQEWFAAFGKWWKYPEEGEF